MYGQHHNRLKAQLQAIQRGNRISKANAHRHAVRRAKAQQRGQASGPHQILLYPRLLLHHTDRAASEQLRCPRRRHHLLLVYRRPLIRYTGRAVNDQQRRLNSGHHLLPKPALPTFRTTLNPSRGQIRALHHPGGHLKAFLRFRKGIRLVLLDRLTRPGYSKRGVECTKFLLMHHTVQSSAQKHGNLLGRRRPRPRKVTLLSHRLRNAFILPTHHHRREGPSSVRYMRLMRIAVQDSEVTRARSHLRAFARISLMHADLLLQYPCMNPTVQWANRHLLERFPRLLLLLFPNLRQRHPVPYRALVRLAMRRRHNCRQTRR
jgi:hypothetical protein